MRTPKASAKSLERLSCISHCLPAVRGKCFGVRCVFASLSFLIVCQRTVTPEEILRLGDHFKIVFGEADSPLASGALAPRLTCAHVHIHEACVKVAGDTRQ